MLKTHRQKSGSSTRPGTRIKKRGAKGTRKSSNQTEQARERKGGDRKDPDPRGGCRTGEGRKRRERNKAEQRNERSPRRSPGPKAM